MVVYNKIQIGRYNKIQVIAIFLKKQGKKGKLEVCLLSHNAMHV